MSYHKVTLSWIMFTRVFQNVLCFQNADGLLTPQQMFDQIIADWVTPMRAQQTNKVQLFQVEIREVHTANPAATAVFATSVIGTGSTVALHGTLSLKWKFHDGQAGRKHRGRYYLAGTSSGIVSDDVISSTQDATLTSLGLFLQNRWCGAGVQGLTLMLDHKGQGELPTSVESIKYSRLLGVQRRRNVGVGI